MAQSRTRETQSRTPRYMQLAGDLRQAIHAGQYPRGRQFPTESALCREYKVSRFTVREALRRLESEGLIQRKRGSGTTVQPASAHGGALHQPLTNLGELLQYARDSRMVYEPATCGELPAEVARQIADPTPGRWTCFRGVRRQSDDVPPIAVTDAYFHEKLGDAIDALDLEGTLFSQIEELADVRVGKVTQDIQAVAADTRTARALEIERNSPVLRILRCYVDPDGAIFEISMSHHPGDRFAYAMHIDVDG